MPKTSLKGALHIPGAAVGGATSGTPHAEFLPRKLLNLVYPTDNNGLDVQTEDATHMMELWVNSGSMAVSALLWKWFVVNKEVLPWIVYSLPCVL